MKKLLSLALVIVMCLSSTIPAFATDINTVTEPDDYGQPYEETTYYDENLQAIVTERCYFVPDTQNGSVIPFNDSKGSGWFKNTKDFDWSGSDKVTTTYAKGYFKWENGDVSVSNKDGGYNYFPSSLTILEEDVKSGTGRYGFIFNKYAYVEYIFKFENFMGKTTDLSVKVRVSESGNKI